MITTPLEHELVGRIRAIDASLDVAYPDELLRRAALRVRPSVSGARRPDARALGGAARRRRRSSSTSGRWSSPRRSPRGRASLDPGHERRRRRASSSGSGCGESDVVVTTASGVHARPLAEFALLGMLMFGKQTLPLLVRDQREHRWERHAGEEVAGKIVCVVGLGKIGREVAAARARARRTRRRHRARRAATATPRRRPVSTSSRSTLAARRRCCPRLTSSCSPRRTRPTTHRLLDARRLALLKPGAIARQRRPRRRRRGGSAASRRCAAGGCAAPRSTSSSRSRCRPRARSGTCRTCSSARTRRARSPPRTTRIVDLFCENLRALPRRCAAAERPRQGAPLLSALRHEHRPARRARVEAEVAPPDALRHVLGRLLRPADHPAGDGGRRRERPRRRSRLPAGPPTTSSRASRRGTPSAAATRRCSSSPASATSSASLTGPAAGAEGTRRRQARVRPRRLPAGRARPARAGRPRCSSGRSGRGCGCLDFPESAARSCSPALVDGMAVAASADGRLRSRSPPRSPRSLMGAGLGMSSEWANCDVMFTRRERSSASASEDLRLGDVVAMHDQDHRFGRGYRAGMSRSASSRTAATAASRARHGRRRRSCPARRALRDRSRRAGREPPRLPGAVQRA